MIALFRTIATGEPQAVREGADRSHVDAAQGRTAVRFAGRQHPHDAQADFGFEHQGGARRHRAAHAGRRPS